MPTVDESSSGRLVEHQQKVSIHESRRQLYPRITVDTLPDGVLLEIFDLYLVIPWVLQREDAWHTLVHVCKRWRFVVFASPRRLQLRLFCANKRPVQNALDIWPELPIIIEGRRGISKPQDVRNIITALKQNNRVYKIDINNIPNALLKKIRAMKMTNPFSALTSLRLYSSNISPPALPDSFLGGSAPQLRRLSLDGVPFPALPKLLLSTRGLVVLSLSDIPYISPEAMVTSLSALTRLKTLNLLFRSPRPPADRENRLLPRLMRIVVPALTGFTFKGDSEYLEDIVGQIDTPLLDQLRIIFPYQLIFDTPLLRHLIRRTETFKAPHRADVYLNHMADHISLFRRDGTVDHCMLSFAISSTGSPSDRWLSSLMQLCNSTSPPLTALECLEFENCEQHWEDGAENSQWVEFFRPFTSVKDLVLHRKAIQLVAPALEELAGKSVTEVLPAIQNVFLSGPQPSGPDKKAIRKFVAARQLSGHPVAVHHRKKESLTWQQMR